MKLIILYFLLSFFSCTTTKAIEKNELLSAENSYIMLRYSVKYSWAEFGSLYGLYIKDVDTQKEILIPFEKQLIKRPKEESILFDKEVYNKFYKTRYLTLLKLDEGVYEISAFNILGDRVENNQKLSKIFVSQGNAVYIGDWIFVEENSYTRYLKIENFFGFAKEGFKIKFPDSQLNTRSIFLDDGSNDFDYFVKVNSLYK